MAKIRLHSLRAEPAIEEQREHLSTALGLLDESIQHTRDLTFQLSPPILTELGLDAALEWLAEEMQRQYGLTITVEHKQFRRLISIEMRSFLFIAVREILLNVVKHAKARTAMVRLFRDEAADEVVITVTDDGQGFDARSITNTHGRGGGFGLFSIRERLRYLGGRLDITSASGDGATVTLRIPAAEAGKPAPSRDR